MKLLPHLVLIAQDSEFSLTELITDNIFQATELNKENSKCKIDFISKYKVIVLTLSSGHDKFFIFPIVLSYFSIKSEEICNANGKPKNILIKFQIEKVLLPENDPNLNKIRPLTFYMLIEDINIPVKIIIHILIQFNQILPFFISEFSISIKKTQHSLLMSENFIKAFSNFISSTQNYYKNLK